jgi:hypothetical protein
MIYKGSCHCKEIELECAFELSNPVLCNCSYCAMRNAVVHVAETVRINKGLEHLSCYTFNNMKGKHYFCSKCGIFIYLQPPKPIFPYAVNLFILNDCNWKELELIHFDGKKL